MTTASLTVDIDEMFTAAHEAGLSIKVEAFSMTHGIVEIITVKGNRQRFPMVWFDAYGWLAERQHLDEAIHFARRAG